MTDGACVGMTGGVHVGLAVGTDLPTEVMTWVAPFRVGPENQRVFLLTPPFFDFLLAGNRSMNIGGFLKVDKLMHIVLFSESPDGASCVLIEPPHEVVRHADIHYLVVPVGEDIDVVAVSLHHWMVPCGKISRCARNDKWEGRNESRNMLARLISLV